MRVQSRPVLSFLLCAASYMIAGTSSTILAAYLPSVVQEVQGLSADANALSSAGAFLNAASLYGWMAGGIFFGWLGDRIGRRPVIILSTLLAGLSTLTLVFSLEWLTLLLSRFLTGAGIGGILLSTTVYIAEIWPAQTRALMLGILAIAFPVGIVTTGTLTIGITDWHRTGWLGILHLAIGAAMFFLIPESPVWQKNPQRTQAETVQFSAHHRRSLWYGILIFGSVLVGLWGLFSWLPSWIQSLLPEGSDGSNERGATMAILGMGGIAGGILSGLLINALGNRRTLALTFAGMVVMSLLLLLTNKEVSLIVFVEMAILALFFGISQGALSSFIPMLFHAEIRSTATGLCFNVGRLFTATAVFFVGWLTVSLGGLGNSLLACSAAFLVALTATLLYTPKS